MADTSARTVTDGKRSYIGHSLCRLAIKVKAGATGCNIICPELDEALADAAGTYKTGVTGADKKGLFEGEQSNPDKEYDADGDMYLTWYLQISNKNVSSQPFNFTLTNQLNSQNDYITHFQLKVVDPRLNPLWYVATGNVKGTSMVNGAWEFEEPTAVGAEFTYAQASGNFAYGGSGVDYDGWKAVGVPGPDGVLYHMPTRSEWASLVPGMTDNAQETSSTNFGSYNILNPNSSGDIQATAYGSIYTEITTSCFGYVDVRNNGIHSKSYWGATSTNGSIIKRYAIRYIGTDYCSVWCYEANTSSGILTIRSKIIDRIEESAADALRDMLTEAEGSSYDWTENNDVIVRHFYTNGNGNYRANPVCYQSTTARTTDNWGMCLYYNSPTSLFLGTPSNRTITFAYRLFRDE